MTEHETHPPLWTSDDAVKATGGMSSKKWHASGISIDTRTLQRGDLFVAMRGDNSDGHDFVAEAYAKGAAVVLVNRHLRGLTDQHPCLLVNNTLAALQDMAKFRRKHAAGKMIAITGSVGKTSVKEGVALVLGDQGKTHFTEGNLNNHIGLPLSMARMHQDCHYGVFEIGMNHAGELSNLTKLLRPNVAAVISVEPMHLEFFRSVDEIAEAKAEIFEGLTQSGTAVLPADNPYYSQLKDIAEEYTQNLISFGSSAKADIVIKDVSFAGEGMKVDIAYEKKSYEYTIEALGEHQARNSVAVLAIALASGANLKQALKSIERFSQQKGRGKMTRLDHEGSPYTLIDDSYNAGPTSMKAAFEVLGALKKQQKVRTIAVLGDMLELGPKSREFHAALAKDIEKNNIDLVFTVGKDMLHLSNVLPEEKRAGHEKNPMDVVPKLKQALQRDDIVLIKGSNGSKTWKIVQSLQETKEPQEST